MKSVNVPPMSTPATCTVPILRWRDEAPERARQHARAELALLRCGVLLRRVADSAPARDEEHRRGDVAADDHRVVPRAARHANGPRALAVCGLRDTFNELCVELERVE